MRRTLLLAVLSLTLFTLVAVAQPPGGGGMRSRPDWQTRQMWITFCFDLDATDAQVAKAFPIFRETIAKQKAVMEKYSDPTPEAMSEMQKIQTDLETKVKALLTPEQQKKLADMEAQRQQRMQQMRERFQGGGGPPGGGPPR